MKRGNPASILHFDLLNIESSEIFSALMQLAIVIATRIYSKGQENPLLCSALETLITGFYKITAVKSQINITYYALYTFSISSV